LIVESWLRYTSPALHDHGLGYISIVSMCLGFFAWYQGMAGGGVARIGRLQLAQPALTLGWSALLLGERVSWLTAAAAVAVIAATAVGRNARVDPVGASHSKPMRNEGSLVLPAPQPVTRP
jgi:hypothetical protein